VKAGGKLSFFDLEDVGRYVPPKRWLTLHSVISQKIVFFITTTVRTSNPTDFDEM
jgi:hypothetical protein